MRLLLVILTACITAGCRSAPPETPSQQAARLRDSLEKHAHAYSANIADINRLIPETLAWLDGPAVSASRALAVSDARSFTAKWARVYFVPRTMHEELRFHRYSAPEVQAAQRRVLDHLRRDYFELHEYQRYCQHASETRLHNAPAGVLPAPLAEFRRRLAARAPFVDEITPVLPGLRQ